MALAAGSGARPVRVLVVDDSVVVRRVVARAMEHVPGIELAGVAANGRVALDRVQRTRPDVVILDLEMPEMDGYETLAALRHAQPDLPVIVFSHLTAEGAEATLDALSRGATGFALKPRADGIGLAEEQVLSELLPLISAVATTPATSDEAERLHHRSDPPATQRPATVAHQVDAVVVAVSTGGPNALAEIMPALPADLPVPVLIVQHMPPVFTRSLAARLDARCTLAVVEASDGMRVEAGTVYIAPGGIHMAVRRDRHEGAAIVLSDDPPENSCRPAADVLFRSAAAVYGAGVLGVVLTGMGRDGLRGAHAICEAGGRVIAQTAQSAVVSSMPAAVSNAGLADAVVPLEHVPGEIVRRVGVRGLSR